MTPFQVQDLRFIPKHPTLPPTPSPLHLRNAFPNLISIQNPNFFPQIPPPYAPNPLQKRLSSQKIPPLLAISTTHCPKTLRVHFSIRKIAPLLRIPGFSLQIATPIVERLVSAKKTLPLFEIPTEDYLMSRKIESLGRLPTIPCLNSFNFQVSAQKIACSIASLAALSSSFLANAAEAEQVSQKINIEKILVSIDDFFNRNPFFVAGVTFIWLVVIPLTEEYLKKYKFIRAIDAFRKLRDVPNAQLLDIRKRQSVKYMSSPNLKILNKNVVQVEFTEGKEEGFVKEVLKSFGDPENTILCIMDNFDGDSLKVAELLYQNGFKAAYATKGGLRGKDGWQAIQESLLPPSVHVYPRKKKGNTSSQSKVDDQSTDEQGNNNGQALASPSSHQEITLNSENGFVNPTKTASEARLTPKRSLSPYPNYPDLKPPSSPTPLKPQS